MGNGADAKPASKRSRAIGDDFVAPDGGWGWCVVLAAGCSNLSTFPVLQQFGLLFRDRLTEIGLSGKEVTTIINLNSCVTSCLGLLNGPMFRRFSYRQVAFFGALLAAIGVLFTSVAGSFGAYVLCFSVLYGAGTGINQSANSLALNTYFKERRRIATGISWTATALGPILFPQVIALLVPLYDVQGTVLLFGALALNAVALSLAYQPVEWHTIAAPAALAPSPSDADGERPAAAATVGRCAHCTRPVGAPPAAAEIGGYAIVDPGMPMLSHANDGWFSTTPAKRSLYSSRVSLASGFVSRMASAANLQAVAASAVATSSTGVKSSIGRAPPANADEVTTERRSNRTSSANPVKEAKRDKLQKQKLTGAQKIDEADTEDCPSLKAPQDLGGVNGNAADPLTPATAEPQQRPVFAINDGFRRNRASRRNDDRQPLNNTDEPPASTVGWLTVRSNLPTRNQSALSIFDMTPRRNFSTTSFHAEKEVLRNVRNQLEQYVGEANEMNVGGCTCRARDGIGNDPDNNHSDANALGNADDADDVTFSWWQRLFIFFDLDLLRDWSYVNLMVGMTIACFAELNYSILTPFVLAEYGLSKAETATSMSLLGAMDISVRFFVPFIAGRIGWENKTFFLVGVLGMALGRISIANYHTYPAVLAASVWIGLNKGLRTVFMALVIPSYIPLSRLPGATGLQLLFAGIFYFLMGPVIGWIRDTTNYTVTLHCLNICTFTTAACWGLEKWFDVRRTHRQVSTVEP